MSRKIAAVLALIAFFAGIVLAAITAFRSFPLGILVAAMLSLAAYFGWNGLIRRGTGRTLRWGAAAALVLASVLTSLSNGIQWFGWASILCFVAAITASKRAFSVHVHLPPATPPRKAVVIYNPKSGGGKAITFKLAEEARKRGIEPIELRPGDDLVVLVRDAVARGADALAAAGGDGTQALVATIAAEHDLPFACIPAGTRNHFALDLGVDRDDVVGALDAFVSGGEKRVDLGLVGGRVFVNNASLGLYAEAVQQEGYRDAKIRTLMDTAATVLGPDGDGSSTMRWSGPDGRLEHSAAVILVSNNVYRLGRVMGSGTRPRMDEGRLGVAVIGSANSDGGRRQALRQWSTDRFVVEGDGPLPIGVDGEALLMPSPLVFEIKPAALRVRIAPQHPGASPSAGLPGSFGEGISRLTRIALG